MSIRNVSSAGEEAFETVVQTKAEAAKGDQQAIQKLARQAVNQPAPEAPAITVKGSRSHIDTTA